MTDIIWHTSVPKGVKEITREDVDVELAGLSAPENLVFHTVFLSDDEDGPCVIVWGVAGDDRFHAAYYGTAELVSLTEESIH